jgi:hypothetical protein
MNAAFALMKQLLSLKTLMKLAGSGDPKALQADLPLGRYPHLLEVAPSTTQGRAQAATTLS